jgi:hypothetical protein
VAGFFSYPNPVNEKSVRVVAGGVLVLSASTVVLSLAVGSQWLWLAVVLAYGFAARALAGPRLSPLALLATYVIAPRLGKPKPVAGPPKRFAQLMGFVMAALAVVLHVGGYDGASLVFVGLIVLASGLESIFGFCVGCTVFGGLMRMGWIPDDTCEACNNIWTRIPQPD